MPGWDTIFALSSARGRAGVSVVRVSGPKAAAALQALTGLPAPQPRTATLRTLRDTAGDTIDRALVLWFPAPSSFTGEDTVEFHVHGSRAVIDALARALGSFEGLRPADPGEFTRRAFDSGKLDLTQAEGLADLIAAETAAQRRLALRQMEGGLRERVDAWRTALIRAGAHLEACIDFPEDEIPEGLIEGVVAEAAALKADLQRHLDGSRRGEITRDGLAVVILGAPNVGKSSLLNALARRDVAIVSPIPGTTRDPIEVHLDLEGYAVTLIDTAGLRDTIDEIEAEGMRRAHARAAAADLRLAVSDCLGDGMDSRVTQAIPGADAIVLNKVDLLQVQAPQPNAGTVPVFHVSARTGHGIDTLVTWLTREVVARAGSGEAAPLTRARHRHALEAVTRHLARFLDNHAHHAAGIDILAEDLRMAARDLGRLTGRIDVEDYLDVIFRDFCIGK
ncbi:MAG: tRNA uridine-5-carboxymethylaminomethyl(34) synthesis GTPase MnmE [Alphaproteobacteria bacterium]|jgi:tRNA modification GTPase